MYGLKSRYWYLYRPMNLLSISSVSAFSIGNVEHIGPDIGRYYKVYTVSGTSNMIRYCQYIFETMLERVLTIFWWKKLWIRDAPTTGDWGGATETNHRIY